MKKSKCGEVGQSSDGVVGKTGVPLCSVSALLGYVEVGGNQPGPFFFNIAKGIITKPWFVSQVWAILNII